jgi:LacI family transcriptional regulator
MIPLHLDPHLRTPLYVQIVEQIEAAVGAKQLTPGTPLWSARAIARHYGISYQTAERALTLLAQRGVVERTRRGTVVASNVVKPPVQQHLIALIYTWFIPGALPSYSVNEMRMLHAAAEECARHLWGSLLLHFPDKGASASYLQEWERHHRFDAALVFGALHDEGLLWMQRRGYPVVVVDAEPEVPIPRVVQANREGTRQAVRELIRLGHRRIGFLTGHYMPHYAQRFEGYMEALLEAGITPEANWVMQHGKPRPTVQDALRRLLEVRPPLTAIVGASDILLAFAYPAITEMNVRVPEELSLIGFDDEPFCTTMQPPLSSVRVDLEQLARTGVRLLMDMMDGKPVPHRVEIPAQVVLRDSCAPPFSHNTFTSQHQKEGSP